MDARFNAGVVQSVSQHYRSAPRVVCQFCDTLAASMAAADCLCPGTMDSFAGLDCASSCGSAANNIPAIAAETGRFLDLAEFIS